MINVWKSLNATGVIAHVSTCLVFLKHESKGLYVQKPWDLLVA